MFVSHMHCMYVVKEIVSLRVLGQLMGVVRNRMCTQLQEESLDES